MKLQLKRSLRLSNGSAQAPSADQMGFGELAINYSQEDPTIFLKDSSNVVRKLRLSLLPDASNSSVQSGTLDERYLKLDGGTLTGTLNGTEFVGGVARVSANAPASGGESELWFNSANGRLYIRYSDQWVDASPDSFTMGTDFYSKSQTDTEISNAVSALANGAVAGNTSAITSLTNGAVADNTAANVANAANIAQEITDRQNAVSAETTARQAAVTAETTARNAAIAAEAATRQTAISDETAARQAAISTEATTRAEAISAEATARANADDLKLNKTGGTISGDLSVTGNVSNSTAPSADAHLTNKAYVDSKAATNAAAIESLSNGAPELLNTLNELAQAIGDDENFATTVTGQITAETTARQNAISAEAASRLAADTQLQANIDAAVSNLADGAVADSSAAVTALANGAVATNTANIATNASGISANATAISTNASGISSNATAISTNASGITANSNAITALTNGAVADNAAAIAALGTGSVADTNALATANQADIASLQTEVNNNASSINTNAGNISANSTAITNLTNGAPALLNTLNELAAAIGDDANFSTTVANQISSVQSSVTSLTNGQVATNTSNISSNTSAISANATAISNNDSDIASLQSGAATASTERSSLQSSINSLNTSVNNLQTDLNTEEATRLAAVADKMDIAGGTFTGPVSFAAGLTSKGSGSTPGQIQLNCEHNSHGIKLRGPAHTHAANYTLTLPPNTGSNGQFLKTDGAGQLSWGTVNLNNYDTSAEVDAKINALVNGAPGALNTLNELAAALGDDSNFASTMTTALAAKANTSSLATVATTGSYNSLSNRPSIPTVNNASITLRSYGQNSNASSTFALNQSSNETITLPQIRYSDLSGTPDVNSISSSAPSSPATGEFWTDTSSDPPVLKTWNGSAWLEVGSADNDVLAPVINSVTLTDNNTGNNRFTGSDFTVAANMYENGSPVSQKGLKATIQAIYDEPIQADPVHTNVYSEIDRNGANWVATEEYALNTSQPETNQEYWWMETNGGAYGSGMYRFYYHKDRWSLWFYPDPSKRPYLSIAGSYVGGSYANRTSGIQVNNGLCKVGNVYWVALYSSSSMRETIGIMWNNSMTSQSGVYDQYEINNDNSRGCNARLCSDGEVAYRFGPNANRTWKLECTNQNIADGLVAKSDYNWITLLDNFTLSDEDLSAAGQYDLRYNNLVFDKATSTLILVCTEKNQTTDTTELWEMRFTVNFGDFSASRLSNPVRQLFPTQVASVGACYSFDHGAFVLAQNRIHKYNNGSWDVGLPINDYVFSQKVGFLKNGAVAASAAGPDYTKAVISYDLGNTWQDYGTIANWNNVQYTYGIQQFGNMEIFDVRWGTSGDPITYYRHVNSQVLYTNTSDVSEWTEGESIRNANDPDNQDYWGSIEAVYPAGNFKVRTLGQWQVGDVIESRNRANTASATRYLVIDGTGTVVNHSASDPGFVQLGPGTTHTLTFPDSMPSGQAPDDEFPAGAVLRTEVEATNIHGTDTYLSNTVTP